MFFFFLKWFGQFVDFPYLSKSVRPGLLRHIPGVLSAARPSGLPLPLATPTRCHRSARQSLPANEAPQGYPAANDVLVGIVTGER